MKKQRKGKNFWNKEYGAKAGMSHLTLSDEPSEDLQKFVRWLQRERGNELLNSHASVTDLGCGNGRNLIWLAREFGMHGIGFDISEQAVIQAKKASKDFPIEYRARSIAGEFPEIEDESQSLVLDMMVSHFLKADERHRLLKEILRILKPGGLLFFKTFLLDEDRHAKRLLSEAPAEEQGSYIHPQIGVAEHVFTQEEIEAVLEQDFIIHKAYKSHGHLRKGNAKRRSICVYAEKKY